MKWDTWYLCGTFVAVRERENTMRRQATLALAATVLWSAAANAQAPPTTKSQTNVEVVAPTFGEPGVVEKPAQLRITPAAGARFSVTLDREIERVAQILETGGTFLVIGQAQYGWRLQGVSVVSGQSFKAIRCGQPQPQASPDATRIVYVAADLGGSRYVAQSNVVMLLDIALNESTPVFPEENATAGRTIVREPDVLWHNYVWGNFLWHSNGQAILFVAARGIQWWDLDLCLVDLSSDPAKSRIARRKLDFSSVIKKGYGPSDSCKFVVNLIEWVGPNTVSVKFDGCLSVTSTTLEVTVPILTAAAPLQPSPARLDLALDKAMSGGFTALGRTPWQWVRGFAPDGSVLSVPGERVSYFSEAQGVHIDVRYAILSSAAEAAQGVSTLRESDRTVAWRQLPGGSALPCGSGGCWSSTDRGLFRLLTQSGRVCVLVTAYGRDVLPGEPSEAHASLKEGYALAMAELVVRQMRYQLAEQ